jgi:hypothetical protein
MDSFSVRFSLQHACSTFYVMHDAGNFGKISSTYRQHEIQYTEWRMNNYTYNHTYNFNSVCVHTSFAIKIYSKTCLKWNLKGPEHFSAKARFLFNQDKLKIKPGHACIWDKIKHHTH